MKSPTPMTARPDVPTEAHKKEPPRGVNPEANRNMTSVPNTTKPSTPPAARQPKQRREVLDDADIHVNVDACEQALAADRSVFSRDGKLGRLVRRPDGALEWRGFSPTSVREAVGRRVRFFKYSAKSEKRYCPPPELAAAALLERGVWEHVRPLERVATAPFLRADGSICQKPGYDAASRAFCDFAAADFPNVPQRPTRGDATRALRALGDLFFDFPFVSDADRFVPVALVLSVLARDAIDGPVPFIMIASNVKGTGKGRLANVAAILAQGSMLATRQVPATEEEWIKDLLTIARARKPITLYDNVKEGSPFGSSNLDSSLTSGLVEGRLLGMSENITLPQRTVFIGSANNPLYAEDLARRVLPCRLRTAHEKPELRNDFKIPDIEGHTRMHRAKLLVQALTVLSAYVAAGKPYTGVQLGSFEAWCRLVVGAIAWAGGPNVLETRAGLDRRDEALGVLAAMHRACIPLGTFTARQVIDELLKSTAGRDVLESFCPVPRGAEVNQRGLSRKLNAVLDRRVDGKHLVECGQHSVHRASMWRVVVEA